MNEVLESYISVDEAYSVYEKQVVSGPLKVLLKLVEKEHFMAAKDILPIVQDSLMEVTFTGQPLPDATSGIMKVMSSLSDVVSRLTSEVGALYQEVVKIQPTTEAPDSTETVESAEPTEPTEPVA